MFQQDSDLKQTLQLAVKWVKQANMKSWYQPYQKYVLKG